MQNPVVSWSLLEQSPSNRDGVPKELEMDLRSLGCELIETAGILLRLPQVAMATAQVLFQRFYYTSSMKKFGIQDMSMGCIFLACKVEECARKTQDIINVFGYLLCKRLGTEKQWLQFVDQEFFKMKDAMFFAEISLLGLLGFNVQVQHPHGYLINYLKSLEMEDNQEFAQKAWNYLNDSLRTTIVVCYQPNTIACGVIFLTARTLKLKLPNQWWLVFDAYEEDLENISFNILFLYKRSSSFTDISKIPLTTDQLSTYLAQQNTSRNTHV